MVCSQNDNVRSPWRIRLLECALVTVLLVSAAWVGFSKLRDNPFPGMQPTWSKESYVSAVSIAFGKGFHSIQPGSAPEVDEFIAGKRASLEASSIEGAVFGPAGVDEGRHFYLEYFVGLSWRLLGVS